MIQREADAYAPLAHAYDELMGRHRELVHRRVLEAIDRHCPNARRVLDIGCGPGTLLELIAARGSEVVGIEPSRAMVVVARERLRAYGRKARVIRGTALGTRFPNPVDAVTMTLEVVNHLRSPAELRRLCRRVASALGPSGMVWLDASSTAWFRSLWSAPPRTRCAGGLRSTWEPFWDGRRRRGRMRVTVERPEGRPRVTQLELRPFDRPVVHRALSVAGLQLVDELALVGTVPGPHTGRLGYVALKAPDERAATASWTGDNRRGGET